MKNNRNLVVGLGIILLAGGSWADTSTPQSLPGAPGAPVPVSPSATPAPVPTTTPVQAPSISKAEWMAKVKSGVSEPICSGFFKDNSIIPLLKANNIDMAKCEEVIPQITEVCNKQFEDSMPATINEESNNVWGQKIGECIGDKFVSEYLVKSN